MIYGVWLFATLILSTAYSSIFYSILTIPIYDKPIDTIDDLVRVAKSDSHYLLLKGNSFYYTLFSKAKPRYTLFYTIRLHFERYILSEVRAIFIVILTITILRTKRKMIYNESEIELIESNPKNIVIATRTFLIANRQVYANKPLHIAKESIGFDLVGPMLPKKSPLKKPIDMM